MHCNDMNACPVRAVCRGRYFAGLFLKQIFFFLCKFFFKEREPGRDVFELFRERSKFLEDAASAGKGSCRVVSVANGVHQVAEGESGCQSVQGIQIIKKVQDGGPFVSGVCQEAVSVRAVGKDETSGQKALGAVHDPEQVFALRALSLDFHGRAVIGGQIPEDPDPIGRGFDDRAFSV